MARETEREKDRKNQRQSSIFSKHRAVIALVSDIRAQTFTIRAATMKLHMHVCVGIYSLHSVGITASARACISLSVLSRCAREMIITMENENYISGIRNFAQALHIHRVMYLITCARKCFRGNDGVCVYACESVNNRKWGRIKYGPDPF